MMLVIERSPRHTAEAQGLIRVCAVCRRVIDENETLTRIQISCAQYAGIRFSHGLCPECFQIELAKIEAIPQSTSPDDDDRIGKTALDRGPG